VLVLAGALLASAAGAPLADALAHSRPAAVWVAAPEVVAGATHVPAGCALCTLARSPRLPAPATAPRVAGVPACAAPKAATPIVPAPPWRPLCASRAPPSTLV
jgi:hypothetical protein